MNSVGFKNDAKIYVEEVDFFPFIGMRRKLVKPLKVTLGAGLGTKTT